MGGRSGQSTGGGGGGASAAGNINDFKDVTIKKFGVNDTGFDDKQFLKLAGIPKDIKGRVDIEYYSQGKVSVTHIADDIYMERIINTVTKKIDNINFTIQKDSRYKGKGAELFNNQVKEARKAGYDQIRTQAAGYKGGTYNGYYTWARLGYIPTGNGSLASVRNIKNITGVDYGNFQTMMRTSSGIKAWKEHGTAFSGIFDLKKGSESLKTLNNYLKNKKQN